MTTLAKKPKRSVWGGVKDKYPEIMTVLVTQGNPNESTTIQVNLPVIRGPGVAPTVIEILAIEFDSLLEVGTAAGATALMFVTAKAPSTAYTDLYRYAAQPEYIDGWQHRTFGASVISPFAIQFPIRHNLQIAEGPGFITPAQALYFTVKTTSYSGSIAGTFRVFYRLTQISVDELLGMITQFNVQSL